MTVRELTGEPPARLFFNEVPATTNFNEFVHDSIRDTLDELYLDNPNTLYRLMINAQGWATDDTHEIYIYVWEDR